MLWTWTKVHNFSKQISQVLHTTAATHYCSLVTDLTWFNLQLLKALIWACVSLCTPGANLQMNCKQFKDKRLQLNKLFHWIAILISVMAILISINIISQTKGTIIEQAVPLNCSWNGHNALIFLNKAPVSILINPESWYLTISTRLSLCKLFALKVGLSFALTKVHILVDEASHLITYFNVQRHRFLTSFSSFTIHWFHPEDNDQSTPC